MFWFKEQHSLWTFAFIEERQVCSIMKLQVCQQEKKVTAQFKIETFIISK